MLLAFSRTGYFIGSADIMAKRKQISCDAKTKIFEKHNFNYSFKNTSGKLNVPLLTVHDFVTK